MGMIGHSKFSQLYFLAILCFPEASHFYAIVTSGDYSLSIANIYVCTCMYIGTQPGMSYTSEGAIHIHLVIFETRSPAGLERTHQVSRLGG